MNKALWVVRDKITTPEAIDALLAAAAARGTSSWSCRCGAVATRTTARASSRAPRGLAEGFDPLGHLIERGGSTRMRIHAWANVCFVWSHPERRLPRDPAHVVNAHPEWLLRPDGVSALDPAGGTDWEGIYTDPASASARRHTTMVFADVATRYDVAGIHYDYVRYPQVTYASGPDDHRHVTELVRESAARLRGARPDWAAAGMVDLLCPMAYRRDSTEVARLLGLARAAAPRTELWGGLMGYVGEPALLRTQVRAAKEAGCEGAILFQYDPAEADLLDAFAAA